MSARNFTIYKQEEGVSPVTLEKASATVLVPGRFCAIDANGLAIVADATSTKLAYVVAGGGAGETSVQVISDRRVIFKGTGDANYAETMRGTEVDLVLSGADQLIDVGASATDVFIIVAMTEQTEVVGSAAGILVRLNKPIDVN